MWRDQHIGAGRRPDACNGPQARAFAACRHARGDAPRSAPAEPQQRACHRQNPHSQHDATPAITHGHEHALVVQPTIRGRGHHQARQDAGAALVERIPWMPAPTSRCGQVTPARSQMQPCDEMRLAGEHPRKQVEADRDHHAGARHGHTCTPATLRGQHRQEEHRHHLERGGQSKCDARLALATRNLPMPDRSACTAPRTQGHQHEHHHIVRLIPQRHDRVARR